jgi:hypothetical protein
MQDLDVMQGAEPRCGECAWVALTWIVGAMSNNSVFEKHRTAEAVMAM